MWASPPRSDGWGGCVAVVNGRACASESSALSELRRAEQRGETQATVTVPLPQALSASRSRRRPGASPQQQQCRVPSASPVVAATRPESLPPEGSESEASTGGGALCAELRNDRVAALEDFFAQVSPARSGKALREAVRGALRMPLRGDPEADPEPSPDPEVTFASPTGEWHGLHPGGGQWLVYSTRAPAANTWREVGFVGAVGLRGHVLRLRDDGGQIRDLALPTGESGRAHLLGHLQYLCESEGVRCDIGRLEATSPPSPDFPTPYCGVRRPYRAPPGFI
eukprot:TRINITY_DN13820_c0_g1_i1.p2 TRINITY_DN13820_c0_g1~~TRINITY_DN13820_c0_g1_i1.p2  ORF type:complete len:308 (+),score=79.28 TRINITY_DN13820_c0_g1_i1:79-924(+)